jgi:Fe-S cluster assembly iron-binding protein IscA
MIRITEKAKEKIREMVSQHEGKYVRLYVKGMG